MSDILQNNCCVISNPAEKHENEKNTSILAFFGAVAHKFLLWRRQREAQALLLRASDRTLKDIGVTRREIRRGAPLEDARFDLERRQIFR